MDAQIIKLADRRFEREFLKREAEKAEDTKATTAKLLAALEVSLLVQRPERA